ncbi:iron ascorbate-dependent oxidoreductase [Stylosanthes scabra]|uniref:Iron ascorbate-dependent oxidoreductase n=1 Tax=Stylosanthes scabra TaxID=79078 RepID=A0ABU6Z8C2_9FABA|nr:iron ascorbate-dependent oxidoreductase [Stylosanthes scabra]
MATTVFTSVETHGENQNTKTLPINLPLDFSSIQSLPESHAWPESNNDDQIENNNDGSSSLALPIIDLNDPNAMEQIGHACEEWGAFQLKNHGIPKSVIEELEMQTKRLFDLPKEQKMKALRTPDYPTGYGTFWMTPLFQQHMWQEGFTIFGSSEDDAKKIWPHDYQSFCDATKKFQDESKVLVEKLIHLSFKYLGISEEEEENWIGPKNHAGAIQLNSYPICPKPENAMGITPHTDTSTFTLLHQSQISGLQIFEDGSGWLTVPLVPNTVVINTGDVLHILSNARFKSALHRVTVNSIKHRYSMVYFYKPIMDHVISPLVSNNAHDDPRFRALTYKEYADIKGKNFNKALSFISVKQD